jgi:hypothetical protein
MAGDLCRRRDLVDLREQCGRSALYPVVVRRRW